MPKFKFFIEHRSNRASNSAEKVSHENCDCIISEIETVFSLYDKVMSLEDKKQLLGMLQYIEKNKKAIRCSIKKEMYQIIDMVRQKYCGAKRQNTNQKIR